jgi:hypothetical protein
MGSIRIRHYRVRKGRGYWEPTATMKAAGFRLTPLGQHSPEAWSKAERLNAEWDQVRGGLEKPPVYADKTLGWLFEQYRTLGVWAKKEVRTREEWELAWGVIGPIFADVRVEDIDFPACDAFYSELGKQFSLHKQHRVFKIFKALMEVAIGFQLILTSPAHRIANSAPKGRKQIWHEAEVVTLRDRAWQDGYHGLAVAIAIAYDDTQMSPVDVRKLTLGMRVQHVGGCYFKTERGKTKREVLATVTNGTEALLKRYLAALGLVVPMDQPLIRNRSGHVYSKDTLGDDFRDIREMVFPGDGRRLMDLRRTGNVEAVVGGAQPTHLSAKLSNTLSQSNQIFDTYSPVQLASVRQADKARAVGRQRIKKSRIAASIETEMGPRANESGIFPTRAPALESEPEGRKVLKMRRKN